MLEQEQLDLSSRHAMHALIAYWNPPFQNSRFATGPPWSNPWIMPTGYTPAICTSVLHACALHTKRQVLAYVIVLRNPYSKSQKTDVWGFHHQYLHSNRNNSVCMCNRVFGSRCMTLCVSEENSCHSSNPCSSFRNF